LKLGDDNLAVFIATFERVLYKAHGQTWPDATKIVLRRAFVFIIKNYFF
jgi:hypothetical protein